MVVINTSQGTKSKNIRQLAQAALAATTADADRLKRLDDLGQRVDQMMSFIYGYTLIDDPDINFDDEIINWTFVDVSDDLNAAIWNITAGFYKTAASCLRNALDMGMASLYFQTCENLYPRERGYNEVFTEWDGGNARTPNWNQMKQVVNMLSTVKSFNKQFACDILKEIHAHFHYLCNFTHGRPYDPTDKEPTNSINMDADAPEFNPELFDRFVELTKETVGWICTVWLVAYPAMIERKPLGEAPIAVYRELLHIERSRNALSVAAP